MSSTCAWCASTVVPKERLPDEPERLCPDCLLHWHRTLKTPQVSTTDRDSTKVRSTVWRLEQLHSSAVDIIKNFVHEVVGNGQRCPLCHAHGMGIWVPHKMDCRAVMVIAALCDRSWVDEMLALVGDEEEEQSK